MVQIKSIKAVLGIEKKWRYLDMGLDNNWKNKIIKNIL